jgi:hypothetical protein
MFWCNKHIVRYEWMKCVLRKVVTAAWFKLIIADSSILNSLVYIFMIMCPVVLMWLDAYRLVGRANWTGTPQGYKHVGGSHTPDETHPSTCTHSLSLLPTQTHLGYDLYLVWSQGSQNILIKIVMCYLDFILHHPLQSSSLGSAHNDRSISATSGLHPGNVPLLGV